MNGKNKLTLSFIFALVGFMIAIQFQTTQNPEERDTRDLWEVRTEIQEQQKIQQELYSELEDLDVMLNQYEGKSETEQIDALKKSIQMLEKEAGLTEVSGKGIAIHVKPMFQEMNMPQTYPTLAPGLLQRLINELNNYGAKEIAIGNERITNLTPIRDVNGYTYVNNHPLPSLPVQIKVLTDNPQKLQEYMKVSQSRDEFAIENLELSFELREQLTLPAYEEVPPLNDIKIDENVETGES
ncbi:DUF881 domain-containing protein [Pontibacillus litoralis]|uniref:NgoFVII family restriction endonuclease n=1 Tax=Pontibacillus litoralis JSM 072002 TaxID=1385512 RepID=A0A0A5GBS1_9BACI|nr:DUF881 domain-containing protein [Pontibacillus litoralis]KGX88535.1 hypothetical protein N784_07650 [Pontibacillus litoralis JSM 072002]